MLIFFCFPDLSYAWTFNDNPLYVQEDNRRFVSQETGNLYIAKVEPSDVGNYTCFITNKEAQKSVQGPPTPLVQRTDGKTMSHLGNIFCSWLLKSGEICRAFHFPLCQWSHIIYELRFNSQIWRKSGIIRNIIENSTIHPHGTVYMILRILCHLFSGVGEDHLCFA